MIRAALALCAVAALALSAIIVAELGLFSDAPETAAAAPPRPMIGPSGGSGAAPAADRTEEHAAAILARPLFSPNRRPPNVAAASSGLAADAPLPRLAGVMVNGRDRAVIFAAATAGAKPIVVGEGGKIGAFTVASIEAGRVTLSGPDGTRVLQPQYDRSAAPPAPPSRAGLAGASNLAAFAAPPGMPQIAAPVPPPMNGADPER